MTTPSYSLGQAKVPPQNADEKFVRNLEDMMGRGYTPTAWEAERFNEFGARMTPRRVWEGTARPDVVEGTAAPTAAQWKGPATAAPAPAGGGPLDRHAFLTLSPEQQAAEITKVKPWFDKLSPEKKEKFLAAARREARGGLLQQARTVSPETPGLLRPTVSGFLGKALKERSGDIGATITAGVMPGGAVARTIASGLGYTAGDIAAEKPVTWKTPLYGLATQALGEGVTKAASGLASIPAVRAYAARTSKELGEWLRANVPAFGKFESTAKGLYDFAHRHGQRELSREFDQVLQGVKPQAKEMVISLPLEDIAELGIKPRGIIQRVKSTIGPPGKGPVIREPTQEGTVTVAEAIDGITGLSQKNPALYKRTLGPITRELDKHDLGDVYKAGRAAYRIGSGFMDFATKGKFLHGEQFDPAQAHKALDTAGKPALMRRGLDEMWDIIRGPEQDPIKAVTHNPWLNRLEGALVGGAAGAPFGIPHGVGGAIGGVLAGGGLPRTTYKNVPLTPAMRMAARLAPVAVGEGAREAAREVGVPQAMVEK